MNRRPKAVLLCYTRPAGAVDITHWDDVAQALEADRELSPCGPSCVLDHLIVTTVNGNPRSLRPENLGVPP